MPYFSIIIPVYNVKKYLYQCIESIISQPFTDYEIILVDDGSTDGCFFICDEYAKKHANIKVIHKANQGLLLARRTGLKVACGQYILHCDSDDFLNDNALTKLHEILESSHYDMAMYGYNVVDDFGNVIARHTNIFEDKKEFNDKEEILFKLASSTSINSIWSKVYKRKISDTEVDYSEYGNISMGEDVMQIVPLIDRAQSITYIGEPIYMYRYNINSISKRIKIDYLYSHFIISSRLLDLLVSNNASDKTIMAFYDRYEHDIYKYLLLFLCQDIDIACYRGIYNDVIKNDLIIKSQKYRRYMRMSNKYLRIICKPSLYYFAKLIAKFIFD